MPKGIPAAKPKSVLERIAKDLVVPGSKVFPGTVSPEQPAGIPVPDGLRVRTERGVELRFIYEGERISETVRGRPTVSFVLEVARKRERIQQLIGLGKFGEAEYAEEFPGSPRFKKARVFDQVMTVGLALDDWMLSRANTVGENTQIDYELLIRNQLKPFKFAKGLVPTSAYITAPKGEWLDERLTLERHKGGPARKIDPDDREVLGQLPLSLLTDVLVNSIRTQFRNDGLGIKRINNLMCPLRGAVTRQVMLKKLAFNPFDLVAPLKDSSAPLIKVDKNGEEESLDAPLPGDDFSAFLRTEGAPDPCSTEEMSAIISQLSAPMANQFTFAFWSGLRTGEVIALRASDLQLEKNRILIRRSLSRCVLKATKTDKQRWVYLLQPAREALERQLALFKAPDGWVFPNPFTGKRWANDSKITRRWKKAVAKAGVRYRRPYQTRHTYASMMLSAGENIMYVAQQMGHADWSMLVKVYGQWIPSSSGQIAGSLVASAHANDWPKLLQLLTTRPIDSSEEEDEDDEHTQEDEVEGALEVE